MFDSLKLKLAGSAAESVLKSLATSKDTQSTITGIIAGAVIAIPGLNFSQLIAGDVTQIAHLIAGLLVALIGVWATKEHRDGQTTAAGALAAVLYSASGQISDITTAVVIAVLGFYTNKPVKATAAPAVPAAPAK